MKYIFKPYTGFFFQVQILLFSFYVVLICYRQKGLEEFLL